MPINEKIQRAADLAKDREKEFHDQLQKFEQFEKRMAAAGVTPNRKGYTIPLSDRIFCAPKGS